MCPKNVYLTTINYVFKNNEKIEIKPARLTETDWAQNLQKLFNKEPT
jgi:hypothetical protein